MFPSLSNIQLRKAILWSANVAFQGCSHLWIMGSHIHASNKPPPRRFSVTIKSLLTLVKILTSNRYSLLGNLPLQDNAGISIGGTLSALFANLWSCHQLYLSKSLFRSTPSAIAAFTDDFIVCYITSLGHDLLSSPPQALGGCKYTIEFVRECKFLGINMLCPSTGFIALPAPLNISNLSHLHWNKFRRRSILSSIVYSTMCRLAPCLSHPVPLLRPLLLHICLSFSKLQYPTSIVLSAYLKYLRLH